MIYCASEYKNQITSMNKRARVNLFVKHYFVNTTQESGNEALISSQT